MNYRFNDISVYGQSSNQSVNTRARARTHTRTHYSPVTLEYERNVSLRMTFSLIRWYTLTYARGKLGIGCIRFKHVGIRWYTLTYAGIR